MSNVHLLNIISKVRLKGLPILDLKPATVKKKNIIQKVILRNFD